MVFKRKYVSWFLRFCIGLALLILCSCDNSSSNGDSTGTVSFNLDWKSGTTAQSDASLMAAGDVCNDYQITTINATIYDSANAVVKSNSFNCSDGSGSFTAIPAGSGYKLVIMGMVSGNADWRGQKNDLSVTDGQTTQAGMITMTYQGSDTTSPNVTKVSPNASVADAALNTTITALFNEAMNGSTITISSFTLAKTSDNSSVAGQVSYDNTSMTATFTPGANLEPNTKYLATLTTGIQDIAGNMLSGGNAADGGYQWTFITGTATTGCTYAISPSATSIIFLSDASSRTVSVIASDVSCSWTATSSDSWISIATGSSGTGNGTVVYKVSENTTGSARSGTVTIAGITLAIEQKASGTTTLPEMIWSSGNWDEVAWQ
jgi:Big-like domain-containing protein/all-beta uncharacterized protein